MDTKKKRRNIIIVIFTAAVLIAAVFLMLIFVKPSKDSAYDKSLEDNITGIKVVLKNNKLHALLNEREIYASKDEVKVFDFIICDIDRNGDNELLVLCEKKGRFGNHRPFWIKEDEEEISQHIFIYDLTEEGVTPKWMASDIGFRVEDWLYDGAALSLTDENGERTFWTWKSWGLERADDYITMIAVGDNIIHSSIIREAEKNGMNFDYAYDKITPYISKMDISLFVSETPLVDKKSAYGDYPSFGTPKEIAASMKKAGFDIAACATNHVLDRGSYGLDCTLREYENAGITPLGIDDMKVTVKEIKGIKIAFINYTGVINTQKNDLNTVYRVNFLRNEAEIRETIQNAKANSDFVVMIVHWGTEYSFEIDESQKKWSDLFLEEGVDLCIGSHPHVTGPVEILSDGNHEMLTYYSLGNFFSSQNRDGTDEGMAAYIALGIKDGKPAILSHKEYLLKIKKDGVFIEK